MDRLNFIKKIKAHFITLARHTEIGRAVTVNVTMHFGERYTVSITGLASEHHLRFTLNNSAGVLTFCTEHVNDCADLSSWSGYDLDKAYASITQEKTLSGSVEKLLEIFKEF